MVLPTIQCKKHFPSVMLVHPQSKEGFHQRVRGVSSLNLFSQIFCKFLPLVITSNQSLFQFWKIILTVPRLQLVNTLKVPLSASSTGLFRYFGLPFNTLYYNSAYLYCIITFMWKIIVYLASPFEHQLEFFPSFLPFS